MLAVVALLYILSETENGCNLHNAVMIFHLSVNLLTNVIVRLTIASIKLHTNPNRIKRV